MNANLLLASDVPRTAPVSRTRSSGKRYKKKDTREEEGSNMLEAIDPAIFQKTMIADGVFSNSEDLASQTSLGIQPNVDAALMSKK